MPLPLPPWLDISPATWQSAMSGGASAGAQKGNIANQAVQNRLEQARIDAQSMEAAGRNSTDWAESVLRQQEQERQLQQQAEESKASDSLQRDKLAVDVQQQNQAQDAAMQLKQAQMQQDALMQQQDMAFKQAQLEQAGDLSQERLDMTGQRNSDLADYQSGLLNNRSDYLDWKTSQLDKATSGDFVTQTDKDHGLTFKVSPENYKKYADDHDKWVAAAPPDTVKVPGKLWGQNDVPNPALDTYKKSEPKLRNYLASPAAEALKQPTATGTSGLPDVEGLNTPAQPAAASLRTPSGITTPDVLKAESGSGLPADIEKAMQGRTLQDNTSKYKSADDVKKAYDAGQLTQEQAVQILQSQFGLE